MLFTDEWKRAELTITDFATTDAGMKPVALLPERPLAAIRAALARYAQNGNPDALQRGLDAAHELVAALPASGRAQPDIERLRLLTEECPEFGALLEAASDAAAGALADAAQRLWAALGLHGAPPRWTPAERDAAQMVFACACAPSADGSGDWLASGLRRVAAARIARLLCDELCESERVWLRALDGRYGSLRHRCAPRTALRSRGLADMLRDDPACRAAVSRRVERWVCSGAWIDELASELEAAVVHARTPARLA